MSGAKKRKFDCSIDDLPVELVVTVFKFLDHKSLLNVSATCKSWKCIADDWFEWPMILNSSIDSHKCEVLLQTRRKFCSVHIRGRISFHLVWKFLKQTDVAFLNAVTTMTIDRITFQLLDFINFMKMFPNLLSLALSSVKLKTTVNLHMNSNEKPDFKQLKKLYFSHETDTRLLLCFTNADLSTLISRRQHFTRSTVWKFLSTQKNLKEIDFCRNATNSTFELGTEASSVTFTLKKIALDYKSVLDFNGITDLVLHQPDHFETVMLGHVPDPAVYAIIFSNLKNLKTLHLMPGSVRRNLSHELQQLQPLHSVTDLRIYDGVSYGLDLTSIEEMTIKIIENLPNLENLELFVPYKQIYYQSIVTNLKMLKSLTVRVTSDSNLENLQYPPVEKLRINCFECFNFRMYRLRHPPILMVAEGEGTGTNEAVRLLTYEGVTNEEIFSFIRKTFPMLELLEVRKDLAKFEHTSVTGIRNVRYRESDFFANVMRFNQDLNYLN